METDLFIVKKNAANRIRAQDVLINNRNLKCLRDNKIKKDQTNEYIESLMINYQFLKVSEFKAFVYSFFLHFNRQMKIRETEIFKKTYVETERYIKFIERNGLFNIEGDIVYSLNDNLRINNSIPQRTPYENIAILFHAFLAPRIQYNYSVPQKRTIYEMFSFVKQNKTFAVSVVPWLKESDNIESAIYKIIELFEYDEYFQDLQDIELKSYYNSNTKGMHEIFIVNNASMIELIKKIGMKRKKDYLKDHLFAIMETKESISLSPYFRIWSKEKNDKTRVRLH